MAEALEIRIAHLEGAYEQFDKRLASVEVHLGSLEAEVRSSGTELLGRIDGLRVELQDRMDSQFRWILGVQIASWLSLNGTMLAFFLKR